MQYSSNDNVHLLTEIDSLNHNPLLSEYENQHKSKAHGFEEDALAYIPKCKQILKRVSRNKQPVFISQHLFLFGSIKNLFLVIKPLTAVTTMTTLRKK